MQSPSTFLANTVLPAPMNVILGIFRSFRRGGAAIRKIFSLYLISYRLFAIQVGLYEPCTVTDFEIPKKYGLRQTIGDTLGIGGIMRALRTIPVLRDFAEDMEEVCPNALFLNYTNPMAMLSGYMQRYTNVKTVPPCGSPRPGRCGSWRGPRWCFC